MICWWCYWGWPKPIQDIYEAALARLGGDSHPLHYSAAHIVWEDENWDSAEWCLANFDKYAGDYTSEQLAVVRWSLEELLKVPDKYKHAPPGYDDSDGTEPEKYPPPSDWTMVKRQKG